MFPLVLGKPLGKGDGHFLGIDPRTSKGRDLAPPLAGQKQQLYGGAMWIPLALCSRPASRVAFRCGFASGFAGERDEFPAPAPPRCCRIRGIGFAPYGAGGRGVGRCGGGPNCGDGRLLRRLRTELGGPLGSVLGSVHG